MHRKSDTLDTLDEDAMITATAQAHGLTVVTLSSQHQVADFKAPGVQVFNPFGK